MLIYQSRIAPVHHIVFLNVLGSPLCQHFQSPRSLLCYVGLSFLLSDDDTDVSRFRYGFHFCHLSVVTASAAKGISLVILNLVELVYYLPDLVLIGIPSSI